MCVSFVMFSDIDFLFVSWKEHFNYKYFERRRLTVSVFEFTEIDLREVEVELLYCPQKGFIILIIKNYSKRNRFFIVCPLFFLY